MEIQAYNLMENKVLVLIYGGQAKLIFRQVFCDTTLFEAVHKALDILEEKNAKT